MRVATRRLRAFLRAGRELLDPAWAEPVREELKWLGGALGAGARPRRPDRAPRSRRSSRSATTRARAASSSARSSASGRTARRKLLAALDSERYFALLDALERPVATIAEEPTLEEIHAAEHSGSARRSRRSTTTRPTRSCTRRGSRSSGRATRPSSSGADAYVKAAKVLQDVLGEHQDAVVAAERLRDLAATDARRRPRGRTARRARARARAPRPRRVAAGVEAAGEDGVVRAAGGVVVATTAASCSSTGRSTTTGRSRRARRSRARATRSARCARSRRRRASRACSSDELPQTRYIDSRGRPKRVRWWRMRPVGGGAFEADATRSTRCAGSSRERGRGAPHATSGTCELLDGASRRRRAGAREPQRGALADAAARRA